MGMSAAHCQGNVREFQSVWRVVTLKTASMGVQNGPIQVSKKRPIAMTKTVQTKNGRQ